MIIEFITGNPGKVTAMQKHLANMNIIVKQTPLEIIEPQADTVEEIALSKARQAYGLLKSPVVVEDSAFCIEELHGFPGPYIKYTLQTLGVEGILQLTKNLKSRTCYFKSALVYISQSGEEKTFTESSSKGQLALHVAPQNQKESWSELWRIFIANGTNKPLSALGPEEYDRMHAQWAKKSKFTEFGEWLQQTS